MFKVLGIVIAFGAMVFNGGHAFADEILYLYTWADYTSPDLIEKFNRESGISVRIDTYDSNETLLSKLRAGGGSSYDLVVPSNSIVPGMIREGFLYKVNAERLKGFSNIIDTLKNPPWDRRNHFTIPLHHGTTSFIVDTAVYKGDINTYKVLFDPPQELRGKVGMLGSSGEVITTALVSLGLPITTENPTDMNRVLQLLLRQKPFVKTYNSDAILDQLVSGEVAAQMIWNGHALRARLKKSSLKYSYPVEGVPYWVDNLAILEGSQHKESALKFLEFMLKPENSAIQSNYTRYGSPIKGSGPYLEKQLRDAPELNIPAGTKLVFLKQITPTTVGLYDKVWSKLKQ